MGPNLEKPPEAEPFRGLKWDALEAGTRGPLHPLVARAGACGADMPWFDRSTEDIMPTLLEACGLNVPAPIEGVPPLDGQSQWAMIQDPALHGGAGKFAFIGMAERALQSHPHGALEALLLGNRAGLEARGPEGRSRLCQIWSKIPARESISPQSIHRGWNTCFK